MKKQSKTEQKQNNPEQSKTPSKQNNSPAEKRPSVSEETKERLVKQYADRAEAEQAPSRGYGAPRDTIAPGSIDPDVDTVYRAGADDPSGYYSQAQLNNAMSGPDANAIFAATHNQQDIADYNEPYWQEYLGDLERMGRKLNTAQQRPDIPMYQNGAYVSGADAFTGEDGHVLNPGQGSTVGLPEWMLGYGLNPMTGFEKHMSDIYGEGNINLHNRPQYRQPDGSVSTVNSISFQDENGQEVLVPTIAYDDYGNPVQLTDDEAIDRYYRTGEYLGKFNTPEDADSYAQALHQMQEDYYLNRRERRNPRDLW
jgi:hypothetical protein